MCVDDSVRKYIVALIQARVRTRTWCWAPARADRWRSTAAQARRRQRSAATSSRTMCDDRALAPPHRCIVRPESALRPNGGEYHRCPSGSNTAGSRHGGAVGETTLPADRNCPAAS